MVSNKFNAQMNVQTWSWLSPCFKPNESAKRGLIQNRILFIISFDCIIFEYQQHSEAQSNTLSTYEFLYGNSANKKEYILIIILQKQKVRI